MAMTPEERAELDALRFEVMALREHLARLAVAQVQGGIAMTLLRRRAQPDALGITGPDPGPDIKAALENAKAVAEALVPR